MALLNKLQFKQMLSEGQTQRTTATNEQADRVLKYVTKLFPKLMLTPRLLTQMDISIVYRFGQQSLFHVRAFPRKHPDTFVIVVTDAQDNRTDHILIDIAAEYAKKQPRRPQFALIESPTEQDIRKVIHGIAPGQLDPFAVLGTADGGTYIQTYRDPSGFLLEYQLVNTSSHYRVKKLLSADQVVDAMISYAFGNDEWLQSFVWQHVKLP